MKKIFLILMVAIIGSFVPRGVWAQESSDNTSNNGGNNQTPHLMHFLGGISPIDCHNGFVLKSGIDLKGDSLFPEMNLLLSWSVPYSYPYQTTSWGLSYTIYPMQNKKFGKYFGFGAEVECHYWCKFDIVSIAKFRNDVTDLLKKASSTGEIKFWVVTPIVEFSLPIKKVRLGTKINPLGWGLWDLLPSGGFTHAKQWYDIDLFISINFGK